MSNCRYCKDGKCKNMEYQANAYRISRKTLTIVLQHLTRLKKHAKKSSIYGNSAVYITEEDIADLRNGKILMHDDSEYCTLVILKGKAENETENRKTMQA